jgi:hypothetical protein
VPSEDIAKAIATIAELSKPPATNGRGKLVVVSTGISPEHLTFQAFRAIMEARKLYYAGHSSKWIKQLRPDAEDIDVFRRNDRDRLEAYDDIVDVTLNPVRAGIDTTVAYYGNAALATWPAHAAVRRARREGLRGVMDPALLYESPFTDFDSKGVEGVFKGPPSYLGLNNCREKCCKRELQR